MVYLSRVNMAARKQRNHSRALLDAAKRENVRLLHKVQQPSWSSDEDITTLLKLLSLVTSGSTTVSDTRTQHGAITQTTGFVEDLCGQLASRGHDEHQRFRTNRVRGRVESGSQIRTRCSKLLCFTHQLREHGDKKSRSFTRSCVLVSFRPS